MTVKELIERLKSLPEDYVVLYDDKDRCDFRVRQIVVLDNFKEVWLEDDDLD